MCKIREEILEAIRSDTVLDTLNELYSGHREDRTVIGREIAILHNQGDVDALDVFQKLVQGDNQHKFFSARSVFEDCLPYINAPVLNVIQCIKHFTEQTGRSTFIPLQFFDYCEADCARPEILLELAIDHTQQWENYLTAALISGARLDIDLYVKKSIELTVNNQPEIQTAAVFALGRINFGERTDLIIKSINTLKLVSEGSANDQLFAAVLKAAYSLYEADNSKEDQILSIIETVLNAPKELLLYSVSELIAYEKNKLPDSIINLLLIAFEHTNPRETKTLNNLDYCLLDLLKNDRGQDALKLIEVLLVRNGGDVSISQFDSFIIELVKNNRALLNSTITRWLLSGVIRLGASSLDLIEHGAGKKQTLSVDEQQLKELEAGACLYLAKKACGWLFTNPVCAVSFMLSLVDHASEDEAKAIAEIIFNPLLISYPGSVKEYLQEYSVNASERGKSIADQLLTDLEHYHEGLDSVRHIKALSPSTAHRETYYRKHNRQMSESYKEAQKGSLMEIFGKPSVLLYGNSSIHYVYNSPNEEKTRQEVPLQSFSTSVEYPSLQRLDAQGLEMRLHMLRLEGCSS